MNISNSYMSPADVALSNFVKALALPVRICIVRFILENGNAVKRGMLSEIPYNRQTVNQHINELKHLDIIKSQIKDKETIYSVNESVFVKMSNQFLEMFEPVRKLNEEAETVFSKPKIKSKPGKKETAPTQTIGGYIREKRKAAGLSQACLARLMTVDRAWVSKIETDKQQMRPGKLRTLANALSVSADELREVYYQNKINDLAKEGSTGA
ncbi:helix-turn-helix domain-containing protein [Mucilaginibacter panaciglaebae]|uniref:Helix-turn-helix protein n=1 Tax=Mucilaginibacter panaciglaebae TaxID=502331 RepID=A0ABP7X4P7_9SPHI